MSDIEAAIEQALSVVEAAPDGWLDLPDRRRLREAYGPWTPPYSGGPDAGLLRRAALLVSCAERALPAWEQAFPHDHRPRELAALVMPALRGERSEDEVDEAARALRADVEPLGVGDAQGAAPFFAGRAAVNLHFEAWDGDLDPELDPPETRDRDLDEPRVEALAAWALAFGDTEGTRAYWRWYVTEAFPAAYGVAA